MKRLINKIIIKINPDRVRHWVRKKSQRFLKKSDYYICRVCKHVLPESQMNPEDKTICKECAKH